MLRKAQKSQAKIRLGLAGPSGSGKTMTALLLAYGLVGDWSKIAVIDTEQGSADLYEHLGEYNVLPLSAPFAPEKYIDALHECAKEGMEVVIIDSITHEWNGKGGCLEIHEQVTSRMKIPNSFTAWAQVTPRHQAFIDAILQSPVHIITTVRSKTDYVLTERNGRQVPEKVGMAAQTRDGFEYELTISLDLDLQHRAMASKDRTGLFMDKSPALLDHAAGQMIRHWCENGVPATVQQNGTAKTTITDTEKNEIKNSLIDVPSSLRDDKWKWINDNIESIKTSEGAQKCIAQLKAMLPQEPEPLFADAPKPTEEKHLDWQAEIDSCSTSEDLSRCWDLDTARQSDPFFIASWEEQRKKVVFKSSKNTKQSVTA